MNVDTHLAGLTWVDGIRLIHRKFQAVLEMAGVQEIEADGEDFDPARHEAPLKGHADGEVDLTWFHILRWLHGAILESAGGTWVAV